MVQRAARELEVGGEFPKENKPICTHMFLDQFYICLRSTLIYIVFYLLPSRVVACIHAFQDKLPPPA